MVPGVPTEAGDQDGQDSTQLSLEEDSRDVRDPRGTRCYRQTWGAEGKRQTYSRDVVLIQKEYCYMPTWVGWTKYGGGRTNKIATLVRTGRRSIELNKAREYVGGWAKRRNMFL
jgi:hypothetical protein